MAEINPQRMTVEIDSDFVVFLIGMRINRPWKVHKWLPVFLAMLDLRSLTLRFCTAGHPRPYVIGAGGALVRPRGPTGIPVGIEATAHYESGTHQLARGDCLFLYTDGVTEAFDAENALYSDERLEAVLASLAGAPPRAVVEEVIGSVREFAAGAPQADDIAMLAVRVS